MPGCLEDLKQKLVAQKLYHSDTHILANLRKSIRLNNQTMSKYGSKLYVHPSILTQLLVFYFSHEQSAQPKDKMARFSAHGFLF